MNCGMKSTTVDGHDGPRRPSPAFAGFSTRRIRHSSYNTIRFSSARKEANSGKSTVPGAPWQSHFSNQHDSRSEGERDGRSRQRSWDERPLLESPAPGSFR